MYNNNRGGLHFGPLLIITFLILVLVPLVVLCVFRLEGKPPVVQIHPGAETIGAETDLTITVTDEKSGIKKIWIALFKDQKETVLYDQVLSPGLFFTGSGIHEEEVLLTIKPRELGLSDGVADLRVAVSDCAMKGFFKGNRTYIEHKITIDTRAPSVEVLTNSHNVAQGGACVVIYRVSEQAESGVWVGDRFFPGYPGYFSDPDICMAFFAFPYNSGENTDIFLTAVDSAKNETKAGFPCYIGKRKFKNDKIRLSDNFLRSKMPEFETYGIGEHASLKEKFLYVNRTIRQKNNDTIINACKDSTPEILWNGRFLRLPGSAERAAFADHRTYMYKDKAIDEQTHLGIDLASTAHSPVAASNSGKVVFSDNVGIYGKTVIIDHGFGLFSVYAHLSRLIVTAGQEAEKGEIIGYTGATGMAGGDHLHLGMLIHNTFVNPLEWWDTTWIKHNITDKIEAIKTTSQKPEATES